MRNVSILVKATAMNVTMCVSVLPDKGVPGPINGSDNCWHEVIIDVPDEISDSEVMRLLRSCVLWKTYTVRFDQLRQGAIIRGEIAWSA